MKGLSVKKLAAIAVGGALIGSALAPVVSAAVTSNVDTLQNSDIVNTTTGEPVVSVVVGSMGAAPSDFIWAGNIAAKVAQLANVEKAVSVGGGTGDQTAEPTDLTVDVTVGGAVTYSTETSKTYEGNQYPLQSDPGSVTSGTANDPLIKELQNAQLAFLTNATKNYKWAGSSYSIIVKEKVGINADARMDLISSGVGDLVIYMDNQGDFNYMVDLGDGIPAYDTSAAAVKFTDGDNDNIVIPVFGESFTVQEVDMNNTKIKLIKESDKATYYEGQEVTGLVGRGNYVDQEMSVKVDAVTQAGAATTTYNVRYLLLDSEGNEIDRQTLGAGVYLNESFVDSEGEYALETVVYISDAGIESTTSKGYVTATVGKSVIDIKNDKAYPYDSTDTVTSDDYWKSTLTWNVSTGKLQKITIYNAVKKWDYTSPIYTSSGALTTAGQGSTGEAKLLEGNDEDNLGYDFVRYKFNGFKIDQATTTFKLGRGACSSAEGKSAGCVIYTDNGGATREVPFYFSLSLNVGPTAEGTFMLDTQTFYYKCDRTDTNMLFANSDNLNGIAVNLGGPAAGGLQDGNLMTDFGMRDLNGAARTAAIDINGITYETPTQSGGAAITGVYLSADGNCQFAYQTFQNHTEGDGIVLKANSNTPKYETMFYDDDNQSLDKVWGYKPIEFTGGKITDTYKYLIYIPSEIQYQKVFLLLHNSTNFSNKFTSIDVHFAGTDAGGWTAAPYTYYAHAAGEPEDSLVDANFYIPDVTDLGRSVSDTWLIANFGFDTNKTGTDVNAYIQTKDGKLIAGWPTSTKGGYDYQVDLNRMGGTTGQGGLSADRSGYFKAAWLDYGTKVEILTDATYGDYVKITAPENQIYLQHVILGEATTTTAEGGTPFTGLAKGETGEEGATKVTIDDVKYTAGVCPAGGGAVADPSTYKEIKPVGQLVYLDTPKPAGANIIVGGWLVNKLVTEDSSLGAEGTLGEALTTSGDRVVQLLDNGYVIVAGYTANDTKLAAQDLIDALDGLLG